MVGLAVLVLLGGATLLIWWLRGVYSYWQSKGVVQPPIIPGFGNFMDAFLGRDNTGLIIDKAYRLFSDHDAFGLYSLLTPKLVVRSPELVKQVMASDFSSFHDNEFYLKENLDPLMYKDPFVTRGEKWKPTRSTLIYFLTQSKIKEIYPLMKESVSRLDEYIVLNLEKDIDAKELTTLFTMDNVSSCAFGISSNCFTDPEAAFRKMGTLMTDQFMGFWKTIVIVYLPTIRDLLGLRFIPPAVQKYFEIMIKDVKEHREKNNYVRNDLMHHMLQKSGPELLPHAFTFFVEGFETSSMAASSALYELAMNPDIQETLHDEVKSAFGGSTGSEFDVLLSLPYLEKVIQETMRKHPVMYVFTRLCTKDTTMEIDRKSVDIKKGTPFTLLLQVMVPVYSLHYDPQYFPNPEVFDPERFSEQEIASRTPYTYMPLGEGPRICAGFRFGLTQVKLFVAHIVYKYRILRTEKTPPRLTLDKHAALVVPVEQKWIKLAERK